MKKSATDLNIQLMLQYYHSGREDRQRELDYCLQMNLDNPFVDRVHLLTEDAIDLSHLRNVHKTAQTVINERLTYERAFHYANAHAKGDDAWILANADIFFDESLRYLAAVDMKGKVFALTRHDIQKDGSMIFLPPAYAMGSQDAWIFTVPVSAEKMMTRFSLGIPGCDSRIAHEFKQAGYCVINPSKKIIVRHLDLTREIDPAVRSKVYRGMTTEGNMLAGRAAPPPYYYIYPTASLKGVRLQELTAIYFGFALALIRRTLFSAACR